MKKLYLVKKIEEWSPWYDSVNGFVIRAVSEGQARSIASSKSAGEGSFAWLDPSKTSCEELLTDGEVEVVICDFSAA